MFIFLGVKALGHRDQSWTNTYFHVIFTFVLKHLTLLLVESLKIKM